MHVPYRDYAQSAHADVVSLAGSRRPHLPSPVPDAWSVRGVQIRVLGPVCLAADAAAGMLRRWPRDLCTYGRRAADHSSHLSLIHI